MTVATTTARSAQNGDGSSVTFTVPFYFLNATDLLVYVGGVLKTLTTDYSVSGAGVSTGGSVTFVTAPASGTGNVVIIRDPDQLQSVKYPSNDQFPSGVTETALDKLTMLVQRIRDLIGRSFTLPDSDTSGASLTVPTPVANYLLGWNSSGTGLANYASTGGGGSLPLPVSVANGGTGASTADTARTALGAVASGAVTGGDLTVSTGRLLGRTTAGTGAIEEINPTAANSGLSFASGALAVSVPSLTESTTPDAANDFLLMYNNAATANRKVKPSNLLPFTKSSTAIADQTITSAGALTLAHGMAAIPTLVMYYLVCQTGELGYTAGDVVHIYPDMDSTNAVARSFSSVLDATNINIRFGSAANPFTLVNKTTGAIGAATNANWKLRVKAWA